MLAPPGRPAQDDLGARGEFARAEGLHDIIVGAHLEADDPVGLLGLCGEQDDRDFAGRADVAGEAQAVLAGHHHVENDEVDRIGGQPRARLIGVGGLADAKALLGEELRERLANRALVVDEEDMRRVTHNIGA